MEQHDDMDQQDPASSNVSPNAPVNKANVAQVKRRIAEATDALHRARAALPRGYADLPAADRLAAWRTALLPVASLLK